MRKYHPSGPQPRIPVWGPVGTADRMARAYDLPPQPGMNEEFDFRTYDGTGADRPVRRGAVPVVHPVPAYGLRVTAGGATVAYSGDTGPCAALDQVADERRPAARRGLLPARWTTTPRACTSPAPSAATRSPAGPA